MASKFKPEPLLYFPTGVLKWGKVRLRTYLTDTPYTCRIILNGGKNCWKVETSLRCIYQTQFCWSVMYFLYSSFHHSCYWHEEGEIEREVTSASQAGWLSHTDLPHWCVQAAVYRRYVFQFPHLPLGVSHTVLSWFPDSEARLLSVFPGRTTDSLCVLRQAT